MAIGELPGRIGNFIDNTPGMKQAGRFMGNVGRGAQSFFGFEDSGLEKEQELYGINPRRAYWSAALADLANVAGGGQYQNQAGQTNAAQQQWQEQLRQQKMLEDLKRQQMGISYLNATKTDDPSIVREAEFMFPDDSAKQREYIQQYRDKPSTQFNIGEDFQTSILKGMFEMRPEVVQAEHDIRRYGAMKDLIPNLGNTGTGAEGMTSFRGFLSQAGMEEWAGFINTIGKAVGVEVFSGEPGARELFRALSNQDVVGRAKELYPVSDSDIRILKQMAATLSGSSDPRVLESLIDEELSKRQSVLGQYDFYKQMLEAQGITMPPTPGPGSMNLHGLDVDQGLQQEIDTLRQELKDAGIDLGD